MNDMTGMMDELQILLQVGIGIYAIYLYIKHRGSDQIPKSQLLLAKDIDPNKCTDQAAYMNYLLPKTLVLGILLLVLSAIPIYKMVSGQMPLWLELSSFIAPFIVLVWFAIAYRKGLKTWFPSVMKANGTIK